MFISSPDESWNDASRNASRLCSSLCCSKQLNLQCSRNTILQFNGGGDESKKQWFMRIAGEDTSIYFSTDGLVEQIILE